MANGTTGFTPLDEAVVVYEQAANELGALSVTCSGAYTKLTDALKGFGNLEDARYRFSMEAALFSSAHNNWKKAVYDLDQRVADGVEWKAWFDAPRLWCKNCGAWEVYTRRFVNGTCLDCIADAHPDAEGALMLSVEHPDNVAFDCEIAARERADEDAAAKRAFYGA